MMEPGRVDRTRAAVPARVLLSLGGILPSNQRPPWLSGAPAGPPAGRSGARGCDVARRCGVSAHVTVP